MLHKIHRVLIGLAILGSPWIFYILVESILPLNIWAGSIVFFLSILVPINVFGASAVFLTLTKLSKIRIILIAITLMFFPPMLFLVMLFIL